MNCLPGSKKAGSSGPGGDQPIGGGSRMVTGGRNSTQGAVSSRKLHRNRRPMPGRAYHSIRRSPSQRERQNPGRAARAEPGNPKKKSNRLSGIRSRRRVQPAAPTWQTQASTPSRSHGRRGRTAGRLFRSNREAARQSRLLQRVSTGNRTIQHSG